MDRWYVYSGNSAGRFTMSQDTDVPVGFRKAMKLTCTTADTSVAANEYMHLNFGIEGQDLQHLEYNTANAKTTTVSFYVKGNAAASYTFAAQYQPAGGTARWFTKEIPVTTSWVRQEIQIVGDTQTGGSYGITDDANARWQFHVWLHGGTNYSSGTFADGTWADRDYTKLFNNNQTSLVDSTSRTFSMTGWQFEIGDTASDFEHRSFGEELSLCQRYYQVPLLGNRVDVHRESGTSSGHYITFPTEMRATPSLSLTRNSTVFGNVNTGAGSGGLDAANTNNKGTLLVIYTNGLPVQVGAECTVKADADIT